MPGDHGAQLRLRRASVGGFFFDNVSNGSNANLQQKITKMATPYGVPYGSQCLVYNANSNMGPAELKEWGDIMTQLQVANPLSVDASLGNTDNSQIQINRAMRVAVSQKHAQGIIVSGDPHLFTKRARIVHQAKNLGVKMCYPFQEYIDDAGDYGMDFTSYFIYGPKLATVYENLGDLAGQYLTDASTPLLLAALVPTDSNNRSYSGQ